MQSKDYVLVVEDDEAVASLICSVLEMEGISAFPAKSGWDAILVMREIGLPAVMILDLIMEEMSGWELMSLLGETPRAADVPVILATAVSTSQAEARHLGAVAFLQKPFDLDDLGAMVHGYFPRSGKQQQDRTVSHVVLKAPV